ncbi:MAG: TylF/MycF family methyltransferase, partial [Turicibacter sp.]|nr:TylF/MycF family methyltransferase [Turicibacter sp.]
IYSPEKLLQAEYDTIIIGSLPGLEGIPKQLISMGIAPNKIDKSHVFLPVKSRINFLESVGKIFSEQGIDGNLAEGGVFQGEFAKHINRIFPNKTLYLFDTFEGFDERDVTIEAKQNFSPFGVGHLGNTTEEIVLANLPHPEKCVIKKGFFPETATGLENERFCFVNLDFDLYQPILAGLEFFAPRMVNGGILLVHDYFNEYYKGVKQAVLEFAGKADKKYFPIGDGISVAFQF